MSQASLRAVCATARVLIPVPPGSAAGRNVGGGARRAARRRLPQHQLRHGQHGAGHQSSKRVQDGETLLIGNSGLLISLCHRPFPPSLDPKHSAVFALRVVSEKTKIFVFCERPRRDSRIQNADQLVPSRYPCSASWDVPDPNHLPRPNTLQRGKTIRNDREEILNAARAGAHDQYRDPA